MANGSGVRGIVVGALVGALLTGCPGAPEGLPDAALDAEPMDAVALDAAALCATDADCDDDVFCNGTETCAPGATDADARGCVPATTPCLAGQTCEEGADRCVSECGMAPDADGDGVDSIDCGGTDCDDADPARRPGAAEICDTADRDEDCDPSTFGFRDADGDAYPDATCCNVGAGDVLVCGDDCNDSRPNVHPGFGEDCDGLDNDCDAATDEDVARTFYPDADGDGYGDASGSTMMGCALPPGHAESGTDCLDTDAAVHPGALEQCDTAMLDENCDGESNPATLCTCSGDVTRGCMMLGGVCAAGTERCIGGSWGLCSITPIAEVCNGVDDDCDGSTDELLSVTCYPDGDNDGYADAGATSGPTCPVPGRDAFAGCPPNQTNRAPIGATAIDCHDADSTVSPGSPELCDAAMRDEDCNGVSNPASLCACVDGETRSCMATGSCGAGTQTCVSGRFTSCTINPVAESCNGADDDCDASIDETLTVTCYADADNDGYALASAASPVAACPVMGRTYVGGCPTGMTNLAPGALPDCNDSSSSVSPAAVEVCDAASVDENCDGMANPAATCACSGSTTQPCPLSGVCAAGTRTCASGAWSECTIRPTSEICDGLDNDCDGTADEMMLVPCYADTDNDGYAPSGTPVTQRCSDAARPSVGGCPSGYTNRSPAMGADCNATSAAISPAAVELCDAAMLDEDCDGTANPAATCACSGSATQPCPLGGVCAAGTRTCSSGAWSECTIRPTSEICDGLDNDCDGSADEMLQVACYADADNDGYSAAGATSQNRCADASRPAVGGCPSGYTNRSPAMGADCNATSAAVSPAAIEVCNGVDDDCAGGVDDGVRTTFYRDADGDGFGGASPTMLACTAPVGYVATSTDCNDGAAAVNPAAVERCDGIDNNCDASTDPGCACTDGATRACVASGVCAAGIQSCTSGAWGACSISPSVEVCNGLDDDCDGTNDDASGGGSLRVTCYDDDDDDGYALGGATMQSLCPVTGRAAVGGCPFGTTNRAPSGGNVDCNDASDVTYPGAPELCNGVSDDCDGSIDEGLTTYVRYRDTDGDGREGSTIMACDGAPGTSAFRNDCDEISVRRLSVYVGAPELCDGWDDNCDGSGGVGPGLQDPNEDRDGDGYMPTGFALCSGGPLLPNDCNDVPSAGGASDHPGAAEVCDTRDNDCDGAPDEDPAADASCPSIAGSYVGCSAGECVVVGCAAARADCDAYGFNGCEADTAASSSDCAGCGLGCGGGGTCVSGVCDPPADVTLGLNYTCWRYASGRAACFGNYVGEPGANSSTPQPVPGLVGATAMSAWYRHTCALVSDAVWCWGENVYGQLGRGSTFFYTGTAAAVSGLSGVAEVDAGHDFTCARLTTGAVRCWGRNNYGQLGDGTTTDRLAPVAVMLPSGWSALDLEVGMSHACVAAQNGAMRAVYCWGANGAGQLGNGATGASVATPVAVTGLTTSITRLAGGGLHTCAAAGSGTTYCWGDNLYGQLGNGTTTSSSTPVVVTGVTSPSQLVTGWDFSCATTATGTRCWGRNESGQLGNAVGAFSSTAVAVQGLGALPVSALSAGVDFACARDTASVFRCWGRNSDAQLGNGTTTNAPTAVPMIDLRSAGPAAASDWHSCARRSTGDVLCWGYNNRGQLGSGSTGGAGVAFPPQLVTGLTNVVEVDAGYDSTCARLATGRVYCWGANTFGQLGDGSTTDRNAPVAVSGILNAIDIDIGFRHACALLATGAVRCWGSNIAGGLGDGTTTDRLTPVAASLSEATSISVGDMTSCATTRSGTLYCWGSNGYGQLGLGDHAARYVPTAVPGLLDVVEVATGSHTCARRSGGEALCWGYNSDGQVGDGTRTERTSPVAVLGLPADVVALSLDYYSTCAVREGGAAYCWGDATFGQIGDGSFVDRLTPRAVSTYADFRSISVGSGHVCASRGFAGIACWGRNIAEQLGTGPGPNSPVPVMVVGLP